nr:hypothetical protein [uncultured Blautia sp.]
MEEKKEKLILNGNAFYEIDLQCIKKREQEEKKKKEEQQKRQRK